MNNMKLEFDRYTLSICNDRISVIPKEGQLLTVDYETIDDQLGSVSHFIGSHTFKVKVKNE